MARMMVYAVKFDGMIRIVEAASFVDAVRTWKIGMKQEHGEEWEGTEEPESVQEISDEPVIRAG